MRTMREWNYKMQEINHKARQMQEKCHKMAKKYKKLHKNKTSSYAVSENEDLYSAIVRTKAPILSILRL